MNVDPSKNGWLVALGAALLLAGAPAMAQKKPGGGGGADPCATAVDFPAFIFYRKSGSSGATYVSDRTGKCVRLLASGIHPSRKAFSYPVVDDNGNPTSRGRVVWAGAAPDANNAYLALDFDVSGTVITPGTPRVVTNLGPNTANNESACCAIDLSRNGRTLYASLLPTETETTVTHRIGEIPLPAGLATLVPVLPTDIPVIYQAPPSPLPGPEVPYSGVTWSLSVDYDATYVYLRRRGVDTIDELVRLALQGGEQIILTGPRSSYANQAILQPYWPAAEMVDGSRRVAFTEWIGDTTNSDFHKILFIDGTTGGITEPGQLVHGHGLAWADGTLLGNGFSSTGRSTGSIVSINPVTGATTALVTGSNPQGR